MVRSHNQGLPKLREEGLGSIMTVASMTTDLYLRWNVRQFWEIGLGDTRERNLLVLRTFLTELIPPSCVRGCMSGGSNVQVVFFFSRTETFSTACTARNALFLTLGMVGIPNGDEGHSTIKAWKEVGKPLWDSLTC